MRKLRRSAQYDTPRDRVRRLAERIDEVWRSEHGQGNPEIPLSVVAALSMLDLPVRDRPTMVARVIALPPDKFGGLIRMLWTEFVRHRPDLLHGAMPLAGPWLAKQPVDDDLLTAAKVAGEAAVGSALFSLTDRTRWDVDLLGTVLTRLRPAQARGQYFTPSEVADVMARMSISEAAQQQQIYDPTCGTGGLFRAVASAMRQVGRQPASVTWIGTDIDSLALACCAVNVLTWGLGPSVLLGVGDTLTDDGLARAVAERNELVQLMTHLDAPRC